MLTEETLRRIHDIMHQYPSARSALLPALHAAREEVGALVPEVIREVAGRFGMTEGEVQSVVSFYTMYRERPHGKYLLQVCTNLSCGLLGAGKIVDHLKKRLGIEVGETTPDGRFTLLTVECLGSCGTAPVMQVNWEFHENLTAPGVDEILDGLD